MHVRDAETADLPAVVEIYNEELFTTTSIYTERPQTLEERVAMCATRSARGFPTVVAEDQGRILGVATFADFRDSIRKEGYRFTVEHSLHVAKASWGRGVGRALMDTLFERAAARGAHVMVGGIDGANARSLRFHEQLGFREVARLPETGFVHGLWCDLVLMQRFIDAPGSPR
jgi:phosphinothricin acetyltransferase